MLSVQRGVAHERDDELLERRPGDRPAAPQALPGRQQPRAPVTTLVCKDRVTGHNPVAVLSGQQFSYRRLQKKPLEVPEE